MGEGRTVVTVLGAVAVVHEGAPVAVAGGTARGLLALLVAAGGHAVSTDALGDELWPDADPARARRSLQVAVAQVRKALAGTDLSIETTPGGYRLDVGRACVDAADFERHLDAAAVARDDPTVAREELDRALALWRGVPFAGVPCPSLVPLAARLEERWVAAREELGRTLLALGDVDRAVALLDELCAAHPLRESAWAMSMLAQYRQGRQADALRTYETIRRVLADELGLDPGDELRAAQRAVLDQDPSLRPRSAPTRRGQHLPRVGPLIGRETELARLRGALAGGRLCTLVGPGGVGKTRLSLEVATRGEWPGGAWFVDLAAVNEAAAVHPLVSDTLGLATTHSGLADLVREFEGDGALVVVDNCEHVLDAAADLVVALLDECPGVAVLATSREPLDVATERVLTIEPPPIGERGSAGALDLFLARAEDAGRPITGDEIDVAVEICRTLDGLPLALELAAAQLRALGPTTLLAQLDDRFSVLVGKRRSAPRQQTLFASVQWSVDALDIHQRRLFADLSVFTGRFDLPAVQSVSRRRGRDDLAVRSDLMSLVDKSLVAVDHDAGEARFRLYSSLRAYAAALLDPEETEAARRAHARHYHDLLHAQRPLVRGPGEGEAVAWFVRDLDNVRAAVSWAVEAGDVDLAVGFALPAYEFGYGRDVLETFEWAVAALPLARAIDHPDTLEVAAICTHWEWMLGSAERGSHNVRADQVGTEVVAAAREMLADPDGPFCARVLQSAVPIILFVEPATALAMFDAVVDRSAASGDLFWETYGAYARALYLRFLAPDEQKEAWARTAIATARRLGKPSFLAGSLMTLADVHVINRPDEARELVEEAFALATSVDANAYSRRAEAIRAELDCRAGGDLGPLGRRVAGLIDAAAAAGDVSAQWLLVIACTPWLFAGDHEAVVITEGIHQARLLPLGGRWRQLVDEAREALGEDEYARLMALAGTWSTPRSLAEIRRRLLALGEPTPDRTSIEP